MSLNNNDWQVCQAKAEILAAVGHPLRLAAIEYLAEGEKCVCEIVEHLQSERSNVSRHLSVLVRAGILDHRKEGLWVYYRLKTPCLLNFLACVTDVVREKLRASSDLLEQL